MIFIIVAAAVGGAVCIACVLGWLFYLFSAGSEHKSSASAPPFALPSTAVEIPSTAIDNRTEKYVAV